MTFQLIIPIEMQSLKLQPVLLIHVKLAACVFKILIIDDQSEGCVSCKELK